MVKNIRIGHAQEGFTLVEALISAFIMAFVLGSSIVAVNAALRRIAASEAKMAAMHEARNQLETLRSLSFDDPQLTAGTQSLYERGYPLGSYEVAVVATDTKRISMNVLWRDPLGGNVRTVNLTTKITKPLH